MRFFRPIFLAENQSHLSGGHLFTSIYLNTSIYLFTGIHLNTYSCFSHI